MAGPTRREFLASTLRRIGAAGVGVAVIKSGSALTADGVVPRRVRSSGPVHRLRGSGGLSLSLDSRGRVVALRDRDGGGVIYDRKEPEAVLADAQKICEEELAKLLRG